VSKKKTKKKSKKIKITKAKRIERQIDLIYKSLAKHRETEWALGLTGDRVFERIYELEQIMRGEYEEDGK
jgi:hypothetical protein